MRRMVWPIAIAALLAAAMITFGIRQLGDGGPGEADLASTDAFPDSLYAAGAHILVAHRDSEPPIPGVTRTHREARNRATRLFADAASFPGGFDDLARAESDDPRAAMTGGYFGIRTSRELPLSVAIALFETEPRHVHTPVETEQGFHIIKRLPIVRIETRHILISWREAERADAAVTRSKAQAAIIAGEVLAQCRQPGADFCELAGRFSDDVESRFSCGLIGKVEPGMVHPDFEFVLMRMNAGEISDIVETPFGFHIIMRVD